MFLLGSSNGVEYRTEDKSWRVASVVLFLTLVAPHFSFKKKTEFKLAFLSLHLMLWSNG